MSEISEIRHILRQNPEKKRGLDEARALGAAAAERLYLAGVTGNGDAIVILAVSRSGKIHVKDYGRTG